MRRRDFMVGLFAVLAPASHALAQGATKNLRVGFLGASSATAYAPFVTALRAGLDDLGYVEDRNLVFEWRWANGDYKRLAGLAAALVDLDVDVIVTHGTPGALAAEHATQRIPIVMAIIGDPVAAGVVASIRDPGRNVTGSTFFAPELVAKRVALVRDALPGARRVGLLLNPANRVMQSVAEAAASAAEAVKLDLQSFDMRQASDLDAAFMAMVAKQFDALVIPEDGVLIANARGIADRSLTAKIPAIGFKQIAVAGGLLSYGVDIAATFRRAAAFVDKIAKGARPQDLPIERATRFQLVVNLKTARALGIDVAPRLLAVADEVIE
jgi:putative tryptophan/tyrosine transport system substrate-binding protein